MSSSRDEEGAGEETKFLSYILAPSRLGLILWFLLGLFCLRVIGQMLVAFGGVGWLPPMAAWYSGLLPYPLLLPSQFIIILLYGKVCLDFTRQRGFFYTPRPKLGQSLLVVSLIYLAVMGGRCILWFSFFRGAWWMGGSIPTFFHWVLAGFILLVGSYHRFKASPREPQNTSA